MNTREKIEVLERIRDDFKNSVGGSTVHCKKVAALDCAIRHLKNGDWIKFELGADEEGNSMLVGELPSEGDQILCTCKTTTGVWLDEWCADYVDGALVFYLDSGREFFSEVTHWRRIPKGL